MRGWVVLVAAFGALALSGCAGTTTTGSGGASPSATAGTSTSSEESSSSAGSEGAGSLSHAEDGRFCESHHCIANFPNGHGEVVECSDGQWSHSGGISGACSFHGGVANGDRTGSAAVAGSTAESSSGGSESSSGQSEGPGSSSHAEDSQFCESHHCIANFPDGNGRVVECSDGEWSHSGGLSGACSDHGGESASSASAAGGQEQESSTNGADSVSAVQTLNAYWSDIRDHGFSTAFEYLAPGAAGHTEAEFIASEQEAGIKNAQFHGTTTSESGSSATVRVDSLTTEDAKYGCRRWSGTYTLGREGGAWRIQKATLVPRPC